MSGDFLDLGRYRYEREQREFLAALCYEQRPHREFGFPVQVEVRPGRYMDPVAVCTGCKEVLELVESMDSRAIKAVHAARKEHRPDCSGYVDDLPDGVVLGEE